jgi:hypothetical protein
VKFRDARLSAVLSLGAAWLLLSAGPAKASTVYAAESNGDFGSLDIGSGVFTLLGNSGLELCGLGELGATLYGLSCGSASSLYRVNPANGSLSPQGSSTVNDENFGSTVSGLFAVDTSNNSYSINSSTGVATLLGSTGITDFSVGALSTGSSTLFYHAAPGNNTEDLYTIDTTTGGATLVGISSTGSSAAMTAMVMLSSTLYGVTRGNAIDTINTSTGGVTTGPTLTGEGNNLTTGLAPSIPSSGVPEPGTWGLAGVGAALLGSLVRRRRS